MNVSQIAGYLLEDVLASLLAKNGYRLLDAQDDDDALEPRGDGLVVRGRGARHQADALGELTLPTPFSLPTRLFLEAKFRSDKTGLSDVRNAHGVISDVNEHYSTALASTFEQPLRRYQYRYALFSTSGFKAEAAAYALAHQISLIDLSGAPFLNLREVVQGAARQLSDELDESGGDRGLGPARAALRKALARVDAERRTVGGTPHPVTTIGAVPLRHEEWADRTVAKLNRSEAGEGLLLGFPPAPFLLAMRPRSINDLEKYVAGRTGPIKVSIGNEEDDVSDNWVITPLDDPDGFRLSFGLPDALQTWLLAEPGEEANRAGRAKQSLLSSVTVFLEDRALSLEYTKELLPDDVSGTSLRHSAETWHPAAAAAEYLRGRLRAPAVAADPADPAAVAAPAEERGPRGEARGWDTVTVQALLDRLDRGGYVQARLIEVASGNPGREIDRDEVYRLAGFGEDRSLRGLTRPSNRITGELIADGVLRADVEYPFSAWYQSGVLATQFLVPEDVAAAVRQLGRGG